MHALYNIGIFFLGLSIRIISLFNPKAKEWLTGRKDLIKKLPNLEGKNVVWFHCASLGEFDQGLPLMNKIKAEDPTVYLLVTFFSPSGMRHYHKREHSADFVSYIPLDTVSRSKSFVDKVRPSQVYFIKYEFWSNHILAAKRHGAKIYNISGIFRSNHRFFKSYGGFFRKTLRQFDYFFLQNESSGELLKSIGIENFTITGDSRFDKVAQTRDTLIQNEKIKNFCGEEKVFIVGSSWPKDEEIILPIINKLECKVIIAPHNIDEKHVLGVTNAITRPLVRYTQIEDSSNADVLVLDTIGHLSSAYSFGYCAYIGGGFSGNLHNILEPAVFGMGVMFGPKHSRFPEAQQFIDNGFGFSVSTPTELKNVFELIFNNKESINQKAMTFVDKNKGASDRIYEHIFN